MTLFTYTATNGQNNLVTGHLEAASRTEALATVTKQGLRPLSIKEAGAKLGGQRVGGFFSQTKVKSNDLVIFTRELSTMVGAGVPLLRALKSLQQHNESSGLKKILVGVSADVQAGSTLAAALEKYPSVFSSVYVNMVRAGETAGILDEILKRLALQQEKNATIRKKVKSAMTYPMVLVVITVVAFFGLMLFVIPQIGKILKDLGGADAKLPIITQVMLGISAFMLTYWFLVIPGFIGGVILLMRFLRTPRGKAILHHILLKTPGVKSLVTKVAIARFARTFAALIGAGVAVLEALRVTAHSVGNVAFEQALLEAAEEVKNGTTLSSIIAANPLFPAIVAQMLAVGEETGQTDTVIIKVAEFYEEEVDVAIDGLSSIIEPLMILVMGSMVGLIAASVMGPIASLAQNIKG